jgi:hypothetical protein
LIRGLEALPYWDISSAIQPFRTPASAWAATELLTREAGPVLDALMKDIATLKPTDRDLLLQRAHTYAAFGRWERAAEEIAVVRQVVDFFTGSHPWGLAAFYLAAGGKKDEHRAHCEKLLDRFKDSTDPVVLNQVALSCLLVPGGVGDPKAILTMAEKPLKSTRVTPWDVFTAGLARLNADQPEAAATLVGGYLKGGEHKSFGPQDELVLRLVHGMALARLNKTMEARVELAAGVKGFEERFPPGKGPARRQDPPHGWAAARAVYLMAKPLLDKLPPEPKQ